MQMDALKRAVECSIWFDDTIFDRKTLKIVWNPTESAKLKCFASVTSKWRWITMTWCENSFPLKFAEIQRPWHIIAPFALVPLYRWTNDYLWAQLDFISVIRTARVIHFIGDVLENAVAQWKFALHTVTLIFPWCAKGSTIENSIFAHSKHDRLWTWLHEIDNCFSLWSIWRHIGYLIRSISHNWFQWAMNDLH